MVKNDQLNEELDKIISEVEMPEEYRDQEVNIVCNDCES